MLNTLAKEPRVLVNATYREGVLAKIHLTPHDCFALESSEPSPSLREWLERYAQGSSTPFPLNLPKFAPFTVQALTTLHQLPFGQSLSYGELAQQAGTPGAARAVGTACGRNPFPLLIPCHRILAADNRLGGFSLELAVKERLLDFEGISYR